MNDNDLCDFLARDYWHPNLVEYADHHLLQAKAPKYNEDNPLWDMAIDGPFADKFWKACEIELNTLDNEMKTWEYVKRTTDMHVLPST